MELEKFKLIVKYTLHSKIIAEPSFTPCTDTISAMRTYNTVRARNAKQISDNFPDKTFATLLRKNVRVEQYNTCPDNAVCCISNDKLCSTNGRTLVLKSNPTVVMYSLHQRFLEKVYKYYIIVNFDGEIYKMFREWYMNIYTDIDNVKNCGESISEFFSYNNSSKVNSLYIKFCSNCDL